MNTEISPEMGDEIIKAIANTGKANSGTHDISEAEPIKPIIKKIKKQENLDEEEKNLISIFLYLNAVMDQGRDPEGIRLLLVRVVNRAYKENIRFLHNPDDFFTSTSFFTKILKEEHQEIKKERAKITNIRAYSLFDTKINPYTMHRWGTVMLCLKKLTESQKTLLSFMKTAKCADKIPDLIRNDYEYGLGNATWL